MNILILCAILLAASGSSHKTTSVAGPFELSFDEKGIGQGLKPRKIHGYDSKLPGYHVEAQIATLLIHPCSNNKSRNKLPNKLVLAIRTSSGERPMLERFSLISSKLIITSALFNGLDYERVQTINNSKSGNQQVSKVPKGTYLRFEVVGEEVDVTFLPKAMELLKKGCKVEWIDWYRR